MLRKALVTLVLSTALLAPSSFAGRRQLQSDTIDDALAYAIADRTKAIALLEDELSRAPKDEKPLFMLHIGEQLRLNGDFDKARDSFNQVLTLQRRGHIGGAARLALVLIDLENEVTERNMGQLRDISERFGLDTQNADRFLYLALSAAIDDDPARVTANTRKSLAYAEDDPQVQSRIRARLEKITSGEITPPDPEDGDLEKAERAFAKGNLDNATRLANRIIADNPDSEEAFVATYLLKRIEANTAIDPNRIGVLLPLRGKFAAAGQQIQQAIEYGYGSASARRKLVIADSGSKPEDAVAALEKLVLEQGVIAVLGPLRTDDAEPVLRAANALRVPVVSLSRASGTTDDREWTFQGMATPVQQASALADYVMTNRGMSAFAIFAPDNDYGHSSAEAFSDAVKERGGDIKVVKYYPPDETNLIPYAKELGRKDYQGRSGELARLRARAKASGGNPNRVVLPPLIDFDALFLPDSARRVPLACAGLAYEEFPIGNFRPHRGMTTIPLLGLSGWNNKTLVTAGGPYVRNSLFTDVFLPTETAARRFSETYQADVGRKPTALEVLAVETARVLSVAATSNAQDRTAFRDALLQAKVDSSVTGANSFDQASRHLQHRIRILSMNSRSIYLADEGPPEEQE